MDLRKKMRQVQNVYKDSCYQFITTELELAVTFANRALTASDSETRQRNSDNAQRAYDTANDQMDKNLLDQERQRTLQNKVLTVGQLLTRLSSRQSA
jgi:hypothetical protein